jgi:hypothetical protein
MESNKSSPLLRYAAKKAAQDRFFFSKYLMEFRIAHGMAEDELAQFLGCSPGILPKLSLCRRPDPETPRFRSDVERIAIAFDIQPRRLAQLIREVDTLKALAKASPMRQEVPEGLLATARDAEDSESDHGDTANSPEDEEGAA